MITQNGKSPSLLEAITKNLSAVKSREPRCFLKWLYCLQCLRLVDVKFWESQFIGLDFDKVNEGCVAWQQDLVKKGALLLYCDVVLSQLKVLNI